MYFETLKILNPYEAISSFHKVNTVANLRRLKWKFLYTLSIVSMKE